MSKHITLDDQRQAVELAQRCTRLTGLEVIWSGHLASDVPDRSERLALASLGRDMALELARICDESQLTLVTELAGAIETETDGTAHYMFQGWSQSLVGPAASARAVRNAVSFLRDHGEAERLALESKVAELRSDATPAGDLGVKCICAITVVGGFITVALGVLAGLRGGTAGAAVSAGAIGVGTVLMSAGLPGLLYGPGAG